MQKYKSHKIVESARILSFQAYNHPAGGYTLDLEGEEAQLVISQVEGDRMLLMADEKGMTLNQGRVMRYEDGYISWSPPQAFEDGYSPVQPSSGESKIDGYRTLTDTEIDNMNVVKEWGKQMGDLVAVMRDNDAIDQRWVSIGATDIQKGLMALTRAIAKPEFF